MQNRNLKYALMALMLVATAVGCSLFSQIGDQINEVRGTAVSVATDVQTGRNFAGTAQAIATDVGMNGLIETAQALATGVGESGFMATAQAFATEQGPSLMETFNAVTTEQGPVLLGTMQAMATRAAPLLGEAPDDIPMPEGDLEELVSTRQLISYSTQADYEAVLNFYKQEMPRNQWTLVGEEGLGDVLTVLTYEKSGRSATVTVSSNPLAQRTTVVIAIQPK